MAIKAATCNSIALATPRPLGERPAMLPLQGASCTIELFEHGGADDTGSGTADTGSGADDTGLSRTPELLLVAAPNDFRRQPRLCLIQAVSAIVRIAANVMVGTAPVLFVLRPRIELMHLIPTIEGWCCCCGFHGRIRVVGRQTPQMLVQTAPALLFRPPHVCPIIQA